MKKLVLLTLFAVTLAVIAGAANAAEVSISTTAPIVTPTDESNLGAETGTLKWFHDIEHNAGQTFTPGDDLQLKSFTVRVGKPNEADANPERLNFRLGIITRPEGVFTFTDLYEEEATWTVDTLANDYMTFTLDVPQDVNDGVEYGVILDAQAMGNWRNGIPYLSETGNTYAAGNSIGRGGQRNNDLAFHADLVNPLQPQPIYPIEGTTVPAGDIDLLWKNIDPDNGYPVYVSFGTDPDALDLVVDGATDVTTVTVNAPGAEKYYWQVNTDIDGSVIDGPLFAFYVTDSDGDGFPDAYELEHTNPPSPTALNPEDDIDDDGLTNMEEYLLGTSPSNPDTDGDTLKDGAELDGVDLRPATDPLLEDTDGDGFDDGIETNTGTYVSATDTGTNPANADTDNDGLTDGVETNTGIFVNETDTGTNPFVADTDADDATDWYEVAASYTNPNVAGDNPGVPYPLPISDPCDVPAAYATRPVKVYILAGQSNMVGMGRVDGDGPGTLNTITNTENKFPNLVDETGEWIIRDDVMYRGVVTDVGSGQLSATVAGTTFGPELGFGQVMGYYHDEPVLLIKSSQGNRSISWDYAPPSTERFEYNGRIYAGYGEGPNSWLVGEGPTPYIWYCGKQWDDCLVDEDDMGAAAWADATDYLELKGMQYQVRHNGLTYLSKAYHTSSLASEPGVGADWETYWSLYSIENVTDVLDNFATEYPDYAAQGFEIAGYVWWQGHADQAEPFATLYESNMVNFINDIRDYYENRYPNNIVVDAPFVLATVAFDGGWDNTSAGYLTIADAQLAVSDPVKYPEYDGNVKTAEARGYWRDSSISPTGAGYHYNGNAETYMLVGDALGRAMMELESAYVGPAGPDMVTWSVEPVTLAPIVEDGVTVESYSWSADPADGVVFDSNSIENPTITITKSAGDAIAVTIDLTVNLEGGSVITDNMTIEVYDTPCQATIGAGLQDENPGDVDKNCVTNIDDLRLFAEAWLTDSDLSDLADMAATWLDDYTLTAPAAK